MPPIIVQRVSIYKGPFGLLLTQRLNDEPTSNICCNIPAFSDPAIDLFDKRRRERVVDDSIETMELTKEGFMPFPVGTKVEMRLTHIFEMRDGKIRKEIGIEGPPKAV